MVDLWSERHVRAALTWLCNPTDPTVVARVAEAGAERALEELQHEGVRRGPTLLDPQITAAEALDRAERALAAPGLAYLLPSDPDWPSGLADLGAAAPMGLWVRGDSQALADLARCVAVVGSRTATSYGQQVAGDVAQRLAPGHTTVARGSYGVDEAAHRGALAAGGVTVVVTAAGASRKHPAGAATLFDAIAATGAVVSEAAPDAGPTLARSRARDRLVAALSSAVVVVEAAAGSDPLRIADAAGRLGRPVFAVPGPVTSMHSAGPHQLLRDGLARLVTSSADVIADLRHPDHHPNPHPNHSLG